MTDIHEIVEIVQALDDWYASLGRQFGPLSRPQRRMLRSLSGEQEMRVSDLAEALGLTTAGVTRMLDKLETLGYAERTRDLSNDQRQVYARLTSNGKQALAEADAVFFSQAQIALKVLDQKELADLARLLRTMNTRV